MLTLTASDRFHHYIVVSLLTGARTEELRALRWDHVHLDGNRDAQPWTPRELRHSFVSVPSDAGIPVEQIAQLVGHSGTTVTELVYRHQLRPVIQTGATVMDSLFAPSSDSA